MSRGRCYWGDCLCTKELFAGVSSVKRSFEQSPSPKCIGDREAVCVLRCETQVFGSVPLSPKSTVTF